MVLKCKLQLNPTDYYVTERIGGSLLLDFKEQIVEHGLCIQCVVDQFI